MTDIINKLERFADDALKADMASTKCTEAKLTSWTLEEQKKLLDVYLKISENEEYIFKLIYNHHGCDSYEDIFRDYSVRYLEDKTSGVKYAIREISKKIDRSNNDTKTGTDSEEA